MANQSIIATDAITGFGFNKIGFGLNLINRWLQRAAPLPWIFISVFRTMRPTCAWRKVRCHIDSCFVGNNLFGWGILSPKRLKSLVIMGLCTRCFQAHHEAAKALYSRMNIKDPVQIFPFCTCRRAVGIVDKAVHKDQRTFAFLRANFENTPPNLALCTPDIAIVNCVVGPYRSNKSHNNALLCST